MRHASKRRGYRVAAAFVVVCGGFAGCASSKVADINSSPVEGTYTVTWSRGPASCAPQPLPRSVDSDPTHYVAIPSASETYSVVAQVQVDGSSISVVPQTGSGTPVRALNGAINSLDSAYISSAIMQTEAARAGGHTFFVVQTAADSAEFLPLVQTPPGNQVEVHLNGRGTIIFAFHDSGSAGPLFTTCTVIESFVGSRNINSR